MSHRGLVTSRSQLRMRTFGKSPGVRELLGLLAVFRRGSQRDANATQAYVYNEMKRFRADINFARG